MSTQRIKFLLLIMLLVFLNINCSRNPFRRPEADVDVIVSGDAISECTGSYDEDTGICKWSCTRFEGKLTLLEKNGKAGATFRTFSVHFTSNERDFNDAWPGYPEVDFTREVQNGRVEKGSSASATLPLYFANFSVWFADALNLSTCVGACCWYPDMTNKVLAEANITMNGTDDGGHNIIEEFVIGIRATVVAI